MEYEVFKHEIENYYDFYQKGLKKQANKDIDNLIKELEAAKQFEIDKICYCFIRELCDGNEYEFLKSRGNGRIPFVLDKYLRYWLYNRCLDEKMPELRWFYELYNSDKFGVEYAMEFLEKAYYSQECDDKTVSLLFTSYIYILGWGAHHFPEGCIISEMAKDNAFNQCKKIMSKKDVSEKLKAELKYYEILYSSYSNYIKDNRKKDFKEYCEELNIEFYEANAYYYE